MSDRVSCLSPELLLLPPPPVQPPPTHPTNRAAAAWPLLSQGGQGSGGVGVGWGVGWGGVCWWGGEEERAQEPGGEEDAADAAAKRLFSPWVWEGEPPLTKARVHVGKPHGHWEGHPHTFVLPGHEVWKEVVPASNPPPSKGRAASRGAFRLLFSHGGRGGKTPGKGRWGDRKEMERGVEGRQRCLVWCVWDVAYATPTHTHTLRGLLPPEPKGGVSR